MIAAMKSGEEAISPIEILYLKNEIELPRNEI
jgi:hypothetical protein